VHRTVYGTRRGIALRASIAVAVSLVAAPPAHSQTYERFSGTFTSETPGASTGYRLSIEYMNPADPQAKPYAVQQVVQTLHAGARIDTSVPPRCDAQDAELMAEGTSACPPETRIGGGELDVDSGVGAGPLPRLIENRVTFFNADRMLILLTESTNTQGVPVRSASRVQVGERTFTSEVPPIPAAPPPDPFLAIKRVRVALDAVTAGGRNFITTPSSCPGSGAWTNSAKFTYRNGATYTENSPSACRAGSVSRDRGKPRIRVRGVPGHCASRAFRARVRVRDESRLRRVWVRLDGKTVRTLSRGSFRVRVPAAGLAPGPHRLVVVAADVAGNRAVKSAGFRRCGRAQPRFVG
jgi:hypothetical protein